MNLKSYASISVNGPYFELNEDGADYDLEKKLFMVFDGFGGSGIGDKVVSTLKENIKSFYTKVSGDQDATMPFFFSPKFLVEGNSLINASIYAHRMLMKSNEKKDLTARGGASSAILAASENLFSCLTVGNVMVYLERHGNLSPIVIEDSYRLLGHDDYTGSFKTMPMSAFGLFPELHYQMKEVRVLSGDKFLIATDGVYSRLKLNEISYIIGNEKIDLSKRIEELFQLSNSRGNLDNQTAMILQF